jgi:hypothetical protein
MLLTAPDPRDTVVGGGLLNHAEPIAEADVRQYVERIVAFGARLRPDRMVEAETRQAYVARLLQLSGSLPRRTAGAAAIEAFRRDIMPGARAIVASVAARQQARRESMPTDVRAAIDAVEGAFDLLGMSNRARDEVSHTRVLSQLLDAGRDGSRDSVRRACARRFETLLRARGGLRETLGLESASARAEVWIAPRRRIDLTLSCPSALVFLEAKIDAAEGDEQLHDYAHALQERRLPRQTAVMVYLTERHEQDAAAAPAHVHITFRDLLACWLPVLGLGLPGVAALASYLRTVAIHLCGVAAEGPFDAWPLGARVRWLDFVEGEGAR